MLGHFLTHFYLFNSGKTPVLDSFGKRIAFFMPCGTMRAADTETRARKITCFGRTAKKRVSPLPGEGGTVPGSNSENCARLILRTGVLRSGDARSF